MTDKHEMKMAPFSLNPMKNKEKAPVATDRHGLSVIDGQVNRVAVP
jgi:hypothetical protein